MRPNHWLHERNSFFKYTTADTAKIILQAQKLRWSSPKLFNDPFDIQFDLYLDFNIADLVQKCVDENWRVLYSEEYNPVGPLGDLTQIHRAHVDQIFQTRAEFEAEAVPAIEQGIRAAIALLPETHRAFRDILADTKILCLSEANDNILMWSHYSELHQGSVLEFRCVPELDSSWGVAQRVVYSKQMPKLFDEETAIKMMSGQALLSVEEIYNKAVFTKAADWSYEKGWRIIGGRTPATQLSEDIPFNKQELEAVYLGCQMLDENVIEISSLVASKYPDAKIFRARKNEREFELQFEEIPRLG